MDDKKQTEEDSNGFEFSKPDINVQDKNENERQRHVDDGAARVAGVDVEVHHNNDPLSDEGKVGRYIAKIHAREDNYPEVLYVVRSELSGDMWVPIEKVDWLDTPGIIRERITEIVTCDAPNDLSPDGRVIKQGGEEI
jgi:hypothetical protein